MECPVCGYVFEPFETECSRCKARETAARLAGRPLRPARTEPAGFAVDEDNDGAVRVLAALLAGGFTVAFLFIAGYDALRHANENRQLEMLLLSLFPVPGVLGGLVATLLAPSRRWQVALPLAVLSIVGWIASVIVLIAIGGGGLPPFVLLNTLLAVGALVASLYVFRFPRLPLATALVPPLALLFLVIGGDVNKRLQVQADDRRHSEMTTVAAAFLQREVLAGNPVIRWNPYIDMTQSVRQVFGETDGPYYLRIDVFSPVPGDRTRRVDLPPSGMPLTITVTMWLNTSSRTPLSSDPQRLKSAIADAGIKRELLDRLGPNLSGEYNGVQYQVQVSETQSHAYLRCQGYFAVS